MTTCAKRPRTVPLTAEDVMYHARFLMENDPFKHRAPREEDRGYRALFGCSSQVTLTLWNKLIQHGLLPKDGQLKHLLWMLAYCKTYGKWKSMQRLTQTNPKTLRKWIKLFKLAIEELVSEVVSLFVANGSLFHACHSTILTSLSLPKIVWSNRKKGDKHNDCLVGVDGTNFLIPFQGRKFHSFKYKFGSGLRYEVAVSIIAGELVWINRPYEPGIWNDISMFCNTLISELDEGQRVEADDGYVGEAPEHVKCPRSIGHHTITESMQALVRRRHETINKRFKQWGILKQCYCGNIMEHGLAFRVCAVVMQLAIEDGEPLFSVDYEDPDFNNFYFDDKDEDDDDE